MGGLSHLTVAMVAKFQQLAMILKEDKKGWLICLAVLLITVVRSGITYSFGVFVVQLEAYYHSSMAEQSRLYPQSSSSI